MEENILDFSGLNMGSGTLDNFNVDDVMASEVILITLCIDKSGSVSSYAKELSDCVNGYVSEMKNSHHAPKILVQLIEFDSNVDIIHGYKPISEMGSINIKAGSCTALYDAVLVAMKNSLSYQTKLQDDAGLDCKNIVFIVTDGGDNNSNSRPEESKAIIDQIIREEKNFNSFCSIIVGVGESNRSCFEKAQKEMGIQNLKVISDSAKAIRDVIGMLSASTSSAAAGSAVTF